MSSELINPLPGPKNVPYVHNLRPRRLDHQKNLLAELTNLREKSTYEERWIAKNADITAMAITSFASYQYWRASFRGFNLSKFGRGRMNSVLIAGFGLVNSGIFFRIFCQEKCFSLCREENHWYYFKQAMIGQTIGGLTSVFITIGGAFAVSQKYGLIPVSDYYLYKEHRKESYNMVMKFLKPYKSKIFFAYIGSIFAVGALGYIQYDLSLKYLNRLGESYLTYVEEKEEISQN